MQHMLGCMRYISAFMWHMSCCMWHMSCCMLHVAHVMLHVAHVGLLATHVGLFFQKFVYIYVELPGIEPVPYQPTSLELNSARMELCFDILCVAGDRVGYLRASLTWPSHSPRCHLPTALGKDDIQSCHYFCNIKTPFCLYVCDSMSY